MAGGGVGDKISSERPRIYSAENAGQNLSCCASTSRIKENGTGTEVKVAVSEYEFIRKRLLRVTSLEVSRSLNTANCHGR